MIELSNLETWLYKGFGGLFNLAFARADSRRSIPIKEETIARLEAAKQRFDEAIKGLAYYPAGDVDADQWDAWHVNCFEYLVDFIAFRLKEGPQTRGKDVLQHLKQESDRMGQIISGYKKLNQRLKQ